MLYWMAFQSLHAELIARMARASVRRRFAPSRHWLRPARFACVLIGARVFHLLRGLDYGAS
jgi:hypothetical protein